MVFFAFRHILLNFWNIFITFLWYSCFFLNLFYTSVSHLYAVAEESREHDWSTNDEEARTDKWYDRLHHAVLACVHFDIDLERGNDYENRGDSVADVQHVQHVLYFARNYTDNQNYVKSEKGKCSQNDTRIVLPMN